MIAHEIYAQIYNNTVTQVGVAFSYEDANRVARCVYGDNAFAVNCTYCPCEEGDTYIDGTFYDINGTVRAWLPTPEQESTQLMFASLLLKQENQELTIALADIIGGVSI